MFVVVAAVSWRCVELEVVMVVVIEAVLAAAMVDGGGGVCVCGPTVSLSVKHS